MKFWNKYLPCLRHLRYECCAFFMPLLGMGFILIGLHRESFLDIIIGFITVGGGMYFARSQVCHKRPYSLFDDGKPNPTNFSKKRFKSKI